MSIANFVRNMFSGDQKKSTEPTLLERIISAMAVLETKSELLNSSFDAEKKEIVSLKNEVENIEDSAEIAIAKVETQILGEITAVSSACDLALTGRDNDSLKKTVARLRNTVRQRKDMGGQKE